MSEVELAAEALALLRKAWPASWGELHLSRSEPGHCRGVDLILEAVAPGIGRKVILVELKMGLVPPRVVETLTHLEFEAVHGPADARLVIAPWLSPGAREALEAGGWGYVDLTGNLSLVLNEPRVALRAQGLDRNPFPGASAARGLRGPKAAGVVRALCDVRPPHELGVIARVARVSISYVSRLLSTLEKEGLIDRPPRGRVLDVDVPALLRRWSLEHSFLEANACMRLAAPSDPRSLERSLTRLGQDTGKWAVTGSLGAVRLAPVATPTLLMAYVERPEVAADRLGLLPAEIGANVILAVPFNPVVFDRTWRRDGIRYVAPPQIAADCLGGPGRMPAEGEGLLEWMARHEGGWRPGAFSEGSPLDEGEH